MRALHLLHAAVAAALITGCGGDAGPDDAAEGQADTVAGAVPDTVASETPATADTAGTTLLVRDIPNGAPMPAAERTRGAPPYPDAIVWNRSDKSRDDARALEAFTTDPVDEVVAFYDERLPSWRRVRARDADIWVLEPDQASVVVSEWDYENAHPDLPPLLREDARTIIGVAWRIDGAAASD